MNAATPLVEIRNMSISFGGTKAVDDVSVDLYPGVVVGLLGHNGAGKSTLIKMLSGAYPSHSGEIYINSEKADIQSPHDVKNGKLVDTVPTEDVTQDDALGMIILGKKPGDGGATAQ